MMASLFVIYIVVRCHMNPVLGPVLPPEERDIPRGEKLRLLRAGLLPIIPTQKFWRKRAAPTGLTPTPDHR